MTIAILGGRFDPPHLGHYLIAQQILEKKPEVDEIWLVPANKHQWKKIEASGNDRIAMLKSFENSRIKISDMELKRGGISYSIDTIKEISQKYNHTIYWIIGADIISELNRWEKSENLTSIARFLIFPRDPYSLPPQLPTGFELVSNEDLITVNLSSTLIRKRIKEGKSITHLVPQQIEEYINKKKLYS